MKDDKTAKIDAAVFALLKRGAQTRLDLMEAIDDLRTVDDADAACARLVRAGLASVTTLDGDPAHMLVFGAELPISGPKSEPPDTSAIDPAWPTGEGEEVRPIPDRRLLCRITPERRAQLNAEDAELSREEAELEALIARSKEKLKVVHELRMSKANASKNDTECADVPCREILRFGAGLAFAVRCDDRAAWPDGWPEDGVIGDPRQLTKEDMQTTLPIDPVASDGVCGAVKNFVGAIDAIGGDTTISIGIPGEKPIVVTSPEFRAKRQGRPKGSKNKPKGGAK